MAEVLDASAVLALLNQEPGAERVAMALPGAHISTVNLAEVAGKLAELGMPTEVVGEVLGSLGLVVHPFSTKGALATGRLRPSTRHLGLSLGDRACLVLAEELEVTALTADRAWADFDVPEIVVIR